MEHLRSKKWALPAAVLGGIAIGASAVLVGQAAGGPSAASRTIHAFEHTYTDPGRCLHDTPYDPAKDAIIEVRHDKPSGDVILIDMPHAANSYRPSVLSLAVNRYDEFSAADMSTEAFLGKLPCPELPQT